MTPSMEKALRWLTERGGSGVIDRYGRIVAAGEVASQFDASTWLRLTSINRISGYKGRIHLTEKSPAMHRPITDKGAVAEVEVDYLRIEEAE